MQLDLASILDGSITGVHVLFGAISNGTLIKEITYGETQYITGITTWPWHSYLATEMTKTVVKITKLFLQCIVVEYRVVFSSLYSPGCC